MKLRLLILLAAALAAAPAAGQTIKSLGFNTTNGQVVYGGSNSLTFTNALQFSTNARAATRTNLGGTSVGNSVFTATNAAAAATAVGLGWSALTNAQSTLYSSQATQLLGYAPEIAGGSTNPTGFNVLAYTNTNGLVIPANILIGEDQTSGGPRNARNVTVNGAVTIQYPFSSPTTIYGNNSILATDASTYTNTLATWNSNTVTFATNVTVGGTLAVTGNVTLSGANNTMPNATNAASASSLMTRDLSDDRYRLFYVPFIHAQSSTAANGSTWNLRPFHSSDAVFSAPPWARNVRINVSTGFTNAPITNNFTAVLTAYQLTTNTFGIPYTQTTNALSVTQVYSNGSNSYRFILRMTNDLALPSGGISDAESAGFWNILIQLRNDSSGSLTTVADNWLRGMAVFSD